MTKERPILFSGPMVRAILDGRKTQTRRVVRIDDTPNTGTPDGAKDIKLQRGIPSNAQNVRMCGYYLKCDAPPGSKTVSNRVPCPYGLVEDRLWVRETFHGAPTEERHKNPTHPMDCMSYRATDGEFPEGNTLLKWTPSIFMPRWASRITLEIVSVRVERLQDISAADAVAEGVTYPVRDNGNGTVSPLLTLTDKFLTPHLPARDNITHDTLMIAHYAGLWDSINGPESWDVNPWVWVIEFKRVDGSDGGISKH